MGNLDFTSELSTTATEGISLGQEEASNSLVLDINSISQILLPRIRDFRLKFNNAYIAFAESTKLDNLKDAISPDFKKGIEVKLKTKDIQSFEANSLAAIMLEGLNLLNEIRSMLTGTTIATHFYYKGADGRVVPIKISNLKPVLSLYGASGTLSNPISLAFQMEGEIIDLSGEIQDSEDGEKGMEHYLQILDRAKDLYVNDLNSKSKNRQYEKFWDNKDAEILELLIQRKAKSLSWKHYKTYRKKMGSSGKQTTLLQMGDIGSIQVKYFGQKQKNVNVLRFSMLRNQLTQLETIFSLTNPMLQKQQLKEIFLPKTSELHDEFSKQLNRDATEYFNNLFSKFI